MGLVIEKTSRILDIVSKKEPCSLLELTECTGMKKPTLFLILKSMVKVGMLEKNPENMYSLGKKLFELTAGRKCDRKLTEAAEEAGTMLNSVINEGVIVSGISDFEYQILFSIDSKRLVKVSNITIAEKSFYRNATGRLLLAHSPERVRNKIIERKGLPQFSEWPGISSLEELHQELDRIKKMEFLEKLSDEAVFVACPVYGPGKEIYAIGINIPAYRYNEPENKKEVSQNLLKIGKVMTERLSDKKQ